MKKIIEEFKRGWKSAEWGWYFSLYFLPVCLVASLTESIVLGKSPEIPGLVSWVIIGPGSIWAFCKAIRKTRNWNGYSLDNMILYIKEWKRKIIQCLLNYRKSKL